MEPRGRAHFGIRERPESRLHVILREGKTVEERMAENRAKILKRVVSAGVVREDRPIINPRQTWAW